MTRLKLARIFESAFKTDYLDSVFSICFPASSFRVKLLKTLFLHIYGTTRTRGKGMSFTKQVLSVFFQRSYCPDNRTLFNEIALFDRREWSTEAKIWKLRNHFVKCRHAFRNTVKSGRCARVYRIIIKYKVGQTHSMIYDRLSSESIIIVCRNISFPRRGVARNFKIYWRVLRKGFFFLHLCAIENTIDAVRRFVVKRVV